MLRAQHRIMLIAWDLDARMTFERGAKTLPGAELRRPGAGRRPDIAGRRLERR
jgi:hypothetical protein